MQSRTPQPRESVRGRVGKRHDELPPPQRGKSTVLWRRAIWGSRALRDLLLGSEIAELSDAIHRRELLGSGTDERHCPNTLVFQSSSTLAFGRVVFLADADPLFAESGVGTD